MRRAPNIAPWLSVADPAAAAEYYKQAFGAVDLRRDEFDGTVVVVHLAIGDADFWLQHDPDSIPDREEQPSVRMILTVDDPDQVFADAVAAGAVVVYPVENSHGWHIGRIVDPSGHHWEIGKPLEP